MPDLVVFFFFSSVSQTVVPPAFFTVSAWKVRSVVHFSIYCRVPYRSNTFFIPLAGWDREMNFSREFWGGTILFFFFFFFTWHVKRRRQLWYRSVRLSNVFFFQPFALEKSVGRRSSHGFVQQLRKIMQYVIERSRAKTRKYKMRTRIIKCSKGYTLFFD